MLAVSLLTATGMDDPSIHVIRINAPPLAGPNDRPAEGHAGPFLARQRPRNQLTTASNYAKSPGGRQGPRGTLTRLSENTLKPCARRPYAKVLAKPGST